ncbi:hypothetical protein EUX98_g8382 [Antrodiella citrinella]|uniref:Uncharacterized protein n=1 Tax=Antrodiella citrinella TaxID=2447956 RepID=A0A4S4M896_9APHY|nr:hypothetical protein EUX98_g8382 [Antrodiella citrinella]
MEIDGKTPPHANDAYLFHALDLLAPGVELTPEGKVPWRFERKPVNSAHIPRLVAVIVLANLPASIFENGIEKWARKVEEVGTRHGIAFTALNKSGGVFKNIVVMQKGDDVERDIVSFGDQATMNFIAAPKTICL